MPAKWFVLILASALCCFTASIGFCGNNAPDLGAARQFKDATLAKVVPGQTTRAQVETLLGKPWRTTPPAVSGRDVWEYRGQDSNGTYRIHIEFDSRNITTLIAKIPDKTGEAPARVPRTSPEPNKQP